MDPIWPVHLLIKMCYLRISTQSTYTGNVCAERQKNWVPQNTRSQLRLNKALLLISAHTVSKCPFRGLFSATFFTFLCFLLMISLFKLVPRHSAEELSRVPECRRAVMCPMERTRVLDTFQAWVTVLLTVSSAFVNKQYILKVSLKKKIHVKQGSVLIGWQKHDQRFAGS